MAATMVKRTLVWLAALFATALGPALAEEASDSALDRGIFDDRWHFSGAIYLWGAGIEGETSIGRLGPANFSATFGDILSNLNIAVMGVAQARYNKVGLLTDVVYTNLTGKGSVGNGVQVKLDNEQFVGTMMATYRAIEDGNSWMELMAGARLWSVGNTLTLTAPSGARLKRGHTESWVDPMVGLRIYAQGASPFYMTAWGMIGGFGAGSDIDGDVLAGVGYEITDWASVYAGYRAYGVRYADDDFTYDAIQHGPVIAGVFRF
ncbi:MAG: hypothetical protein AcusKO_12560 [Acuticoccus sp.]